MHKSGSDLPSRARYLLAGLFALIAAVLHQSAVLERLDGYLYDVQMPLTNFRPSDRVVIVALDQKTLNLDEYDWPWPRALHKKLIDKVASSKASAIGVDVIFADPELVSEEDDLELINAVKAAGNVVLPVLPEKMTASDIVSELGPFLGLYDAGLLGHIDLPVDSDGTVRWVPLHAGLPGNKHPSFALRLALISDPTLEDRLGLPQAPSGKPEQLSWQRHNNVLIPFAGPAGSIKTISAIELLNGERSIEELAGKIVIIGSTAAGLGDEWATPISTHQTVMSGVEIIANLTDSLLQGIVRKPLPRHWGSVLLALVTFAATLLCIRRRVGLVFYVVTPFALLLLAALLLRTGGYWLAPTATMVTLIVGVPLWLNWRWLNERKLRISRTEQSHALLTAVREGVVHTGASGEITYVNPFAATILGEDEEELVGLSMHELMEPSFLNLMILTPQRFTAHDGSQRWLRLRVTKLAEDQGGGAGTIYVISDVTSEKEKDIRYQKSQTRLRQLERHMETAARRDVMGQVSATIAHEVNQPLTALLTYANACRRLLPVFDEPGNERLKKSLEKMIGQTERAGQVVKRVRSLFENRELELDEVDVNALLTDALALVLIDRELEDLEPIYELERNLPNVMLDTVQIQQVLVNLIKNALDEMRLSKEKKLWLRTRRVEGGRVEVEIEDTGPGVDSDLGASLFDPFVTRKDGGIGLGLSVSKDIVEAHSGELKLLPPNGHGARFAITLPIRQLEELQNA